jgi:L-arabinokinase
LSGGPAIAFYISGHGFGHAIRQIEIINALTGLAPSAPIVIRTSAPRWLFERTAPSSGWTLLDGEVDTGVTQIDSLALDEADTIRRAEAFYRSIAARAGEEAAILRRFNVRVVVADAAPLACAAAALANVPVAVCANFTWDWIYAGYVHQMSGGARLLPIIRDAYAMATAGWRLPMHGGFETVPGTVDVPLVARRPREDRSRDDIRRTLGLPTDRPLALLSFGGYGVAGLDLDRLDCTPSWGVVSGVNEPAMYAAGLRYEDLVRAVDVVITKPGYGIISDCISAGTAMLYTSRGHFAEYEVLVREMPRYLRCRYISQEEFRAGRWREALDAVAVSPRATERPRTDGALVVATLIRDRLATQDY